MGKIFNDITTIGDVDGALLLSLKGKIIYKEFASSFSLHEGLEKRDWASMLGALSGVKEADLVFEGGKLYLRRFSSGYLLILMGILAPVAMVRLSCNLLLPSLEEKIAPKRGFMRFLKPGL